MDLQSILIGVLITLIGFIFHIGWDIYNSVKQEQNHILTIKHELETNLSILKDNDILIQTSIQARKDNEILITPLKQLNNNFSFFLILNCPNLFKKRHYLFIEIRKISKLTNEINEVIQSRENYKINNGVNTAYNRRLKIYDDILFEKIKQLTPLLSRFIKEMK